MTPQITVVTAWWNKRAELERDYWAAMRIANASAVIVDNGSEPPLPNAWRLPTNTGFSHANNVGLQLVQTDACLFLNDDILATEADWLDRIRDALEPGVLVGAQLRHDVHADVDGQSLPYLDGWCVAGMRQDLLDLGGWDETLDEPAYYSDNFLSLEARAAGMSLREVKVGLRHKLNVSANDHPNVARATRANHRRYLQRARQLLGTQEVAA